MNESVWLSLPEWMFLRFVLYIFSYLCLEMLIQSPIYMGLCLFRGEVWWPSSNVLGLPLSPFVSMVFCGWFWFVSVLVCRRSYGVVPRWLIDGLIGGWIKSVLSSWLGLEDCIREQTLSRAVGSPASLPFCTTPSLCWFTQHFWFVLHILTLWIF